MSSVMARLREIIPVPGNRSRQAFLQAEARLPLQQPSRFLGAEVLMPDFIAGDVLYLRLQRRLHLFADEANEVEDGKLRFEREVERLAAQVRFGCELLGQ